MVTFLTDFGLDWGPVGACHAVMHEIAPDVTVIDLSHGIPPFDLRAGAWVLASALPWMPIAVHVAVVDPGVGTDRLPMALRTARGDLLVGPDNGLLIPAAERLGGVAEARVLRNAALFREPVSSTFHGRDIFAPVAVRLAAGLPLAEVGPELDRSGLAGTPWTPPEYGVDLARGEVALLDTFGNVRTNLETARWRRPLPDALRLVTARGAWTAPTARTFGEIAPGALLAFDDSSGYLCLGVNQGSAGQALGLRPGDAFHVVPCGTSTP